MNVEYITAIEKVIEYLDNKMDKTPDRKTADTHNYLVEELEKLKEESYE